MLTFLENLQCRSTLRRKILYMIWCFIHLIFIIFRNCLFTLETIGKILKKGISSLVACRAGCVESHSHRQGSTSQTYSQEVLKFGESADKFTKIPKHIAFSIIPEKLVNTSTVNYLSTTTISEENNETNEDVDSTYILKNLVKQNKNEINQNGHNLSQPMYLEVTKKHIDIQMLAKVISWAWAAKIQLISLYDYHGEIKDSYHELGYLLQEELVQNYLILKKQYSSNKNPSPPPPIPPTIKFHNVPKIDGYSNGNNGLNGFKNLNTLHIAVFSYEDGKEAIVNITKDICKENLKRKNLTTTTTTTPKKEKDFDLIEVNESNLDSMLSSAHNLSELPSGIPTEPDVLVILGNVFSTLGFLPWNIRLTEIHWIPKLPIIESEDFLTVLRKYSRCQQRRGT